MAVVSVTSDSVLMHDMGNTTGDGTTGVGNIGGGAGAGAEPDFVYEGDRSISRKVGTAIAGFDVDTSAFGTPRSVDMTAADRKVWMAKLIATNSSVILSLGSPAMEIRIGSGSGDYYTMDVAGSENYPIKGGWLLVPVNPNAAAYQSISTGTPSLSAVDYFAVRGDFSAASKSENVAMDAIICGVGLCLTGGTSTDPDGTFEDFRKADEDTTSNRWGWISEQDGILFVNGKHWIGRNASGTAVATDFNDKYRTLVFPDFGLYDAGDCGLGIDLGISSSAVIWQFITLNGLGSNYRLKFNTETEIVGGTTDEIRNATITDTAKTGDAVIYRTQSGTETPGPTNGTRYWVSVTSTGIQLHTTRRNAFTSTSPVNLTASTTGNGEIHRIDKDPDTKPTFTASGTSGYMDFLDCILSGFSSVTLTVEVYCINNAFTGLKSLVQGGCMFQNCSFLDQETLPGEALNENFSDFLASNNTYRNSFGTGYGGHAFKITSTGSYTLNSFTFSFYDAVGIEKSFNSTTDVNGTTNVVTVTNHPYTTGQAMIYSNEGGTANIGLTTNTLYYVRDVSTNTIAFYANEGHAINDNSRISLTSTGNETHKLYGANAAIWNDSGGAVTLNITNNGTIPSIRNTSGSTTTIINARTLEVTGLTRDAQVVILAAESKGTITEGDVLMSERASILGVAKKTDFNWENAFGAGLACTIRARSSGFLGGAVLEDNGVFTNQTAEANSNLSDTVSLLPTTPVANQDAFNFGHHEKFSKLLIDITDAATGATITWQYRTSGGWTTLGTVVDGTSNYSKLGENIVEWTIPGDWIQYNINAQGSYYYIRALLTAGTPDQAKARRVTANVKRYLPFTQDNTITSSSGLSIKATWVEDTIATF